MNTSGKLCWIFFQNISQSNLEMIQRSYRFVKAIDVGYSGYRVHRQFCGTRYFPSRADRDISVMNIELRVILRSNQIQNLDGNCKLYQSEW